MHYVVLLQGLKAALRQLSLEEGWDPQRLPTAQQLRDLDRQDLIRVRGAWAVAELLITIARFWLCALLALFAEVTQLTACCISCDQNMSSKL